MAQVLIRNLDQDVVDSLKRKAEAEGLSLEAYLRQVLVEIARPTRQEILKEIDAIRATSRPWRPGEQTAVDYIREGREELDAHARSRVEERS
jgi:plasmid stability protein